MPRRRRGRRRATFARARAPRPRPIRPAITIRTTSRNELKMAEPTQTNEGTQDPAPVSHYRFRVRTLDGREMVSAVAVVDPNAPDANQADPKDSLEALDQQHEQEAGAHATDLQKAHESEATEA